MNSLSDLLSFGPDGGSRLPPSSAYVAVTDTLAASGTFVPIYLARTMLLTAARATQHSTGATERVRDSPAVLWLGCDASGESHVRTLLRKAGVNAQAQSRLRFIDAAEVCLSCASSRTKEGLQSLLDLVPSSLPEPDATGSSKLANHAPAKTLVIVDDLSALSWICPSPSLGAGNDAAHLLSRWVRALRILAEKHSAALCTLQHASSTSLYADTSAQDAGDEALLQHLLASLDPDVWIEIRGLRSGRARDCDGEILIRPLTRPQLGLTESRQSSTSSSLHARGTSIHASFALPNLALPPRPLLFRVGAGSDPSSRWHASGSSVAGEAASKNGITQVDDWKGVQLWARGMMRGFL